MTFIVEFNKNELAHNLQVVCPTNGPSSNMEELGVNIHNYTIKEEDENVENYQCPTYVEHVI